MELVWLINHLFSPAVISTPTLMSVHGFGILVQKTAMCRDDVCFRSGMVR